LTYKSLNVYKLIVLLLTNLTSIYNICVLLSSVLLAAELYEDLFSRAAEDAMAVY